MKNSTNLRFLATITFLGTLTVNALANILPINHLNTGEVSNLYPSLFTPAGITFSIWSVIYLALAGFVVFAWLRRQHTAVNQVLPWFISTNILNMAWILAWHYLMPGLSVLIMLALLTTLTLIFRMLTVSALPTMTERLGVALPFTLYFAWICVATIANISALLVAVQWTGGFLTPTQWTVVMMVIAATLASYITWRFRVPAFALVVMWALFGIYLRWEHGDQSAIVNAATVLEVLLLGVLAFTAFRRRVGA